MDEIKQVLKLYFDACYQGDPHKMAQVFHPVAHIYSHGTDGGLKDMDKNSFLEIVASSKPDGAAPRNDKIIAIDLTGDNTAVARVSLRIGSTMFTDILGFIRLDGKWSVISKLYTGTPIV